MEEEAGKKFLIEVLNRGILDLNEFAILSSVITKRKPQPTNIRCKNCNVNCPPCVPAKSIDEDVMVTSDDYRSDEVAKVLEKIIAEYSPALK